MLTMSRLSTLLLLTLIALPACFGSADVNENKTKQPDTAEQPEKPSDTGANSEFPTEAPAIDFSVNPPSLRVYRDTIISLRCKEIGPEYGVESVTWYFEDGTEPQKGKQIVHSFKGGLKAQMVSMTVKWGYGKRITTQRIVPLERISKKQAPAPRATGPVPNPLEGSTATRWVVIGLGGKNGLPPELGTNILNLSPNLILVIGRVVSPDTGTPLETQWAAFNSALLEPAQARGIDVLPIPADDKLDDLKTVSFLNQAWSKQRPASTLIQGDRYPKHYGLRHQGLFLTTLAPHDYNPTKAYAELKTSLKQLRDSEFGVVASYRAPAPFLTTERYLDKAYRLHEHLVRSGVRLMITGQSSIPYLGDYGALNVISSGRADERCAPYPTGTCSGPSAVVLDFDKRLLKRAWVVDLESTATVRPYKNIPEQLKYYRRWDP